jgi:hypothetical protein
MKAVQIGRVSRLLKESSVDCILNIDQTKFTVENMNTIVKQTLSNNMVIDYPIGDKSKTVSCDYMDTCDFKCKPFKNIKETDIKLDTYDESFILMNNEKIIQRIHDLFKKRFFYKKDALISEINIVKNYPIVQINAALTALIDDENEYITDRFNRLGHLRNIEEYYFFQPIELSNENISVFDRRNPIDYKHSSIIYPLQQIEAPMKPKQPITEKTDDNTTSGINQQMLVIKDKYDLAHKAIVDIDRGEEDWYVYASMLKNTKYLMNNYNISDDEYAEFVIQHILEYMNFEQTVEVINYLYFTPNLSDFNKKVKQAYDSVILQNKGVTGLIVPKENKQYLLIKGENKWVKGELEDNTDLAPESKKLEVPLSQYNQYVGFIGNFKNEYNIFKVKNMTDKRGKGARCDQTSKSDTVELLNRILGENKYSPENTKGRKKLEFCVIQELLLRHFNKIKKDGKTWFLDQSAAVINNIEKISF